MTGDLLGAVACCHPCRRRFCLRMIATGDATGDDRTRYLCRHHFLGLHASLLDFATGATGDFGCFRKRVFFGDSESLFCVSRLSVLDGRSLSG